MTQFNHWPDPGNHWGNPSVMLGQVMEVTRRHDAEIMDLNNRVSGIERAKSGPKPERPAVALLKDLAAFLREVASLKEWIAGALLIVLALKGLVQPGEIKALLLTLAGGG